MLAILDYGAGNLRSVCNALDRIGQAYFVSDDPKKIKEADKLIFPGVGHADAAMRALGFKKLDILLREWDKPLLGICLGMQLLFEFSEEGETDCLGIVPGKVIRFDESMVGIVPHMGWNQVASPRLQVASEDGDSESKHIPSAVGDDYYFVHSYYCVPKNADFVIGETDYNGQKFCSIVGSGNVIGMQFHPEKSGHAGAALLKAFCTDSLFATT